jgi:hypothetical protein
MKWVVAVGLVAALVSYNRFLGRSEAPKVGNKVQAEAAETASSKTQVEPQPRPEIPATTQVAVGGRRFRSSWLKELEQRDCSRFVSEQSTNQVPELLVFRQMVSRFPLRQEDQDMAVFRMYALVSDVTRLSDQRDQAVESFLNGSQVLRGGPKPVDEAERTWEEEQLARLRGSWDRDIEQYSREGRMDLEEMVGPIEPDWFQALMAIRPRRPAFLSDLKPLEVPPRTP